MIKQLLIFVGQKSQAEATLRWKETKDWTSLSLFSTNSTIKVQSEVGCFYLNLSFDKNKLFKADFTFPDPSFLFPASLCASGGSTSKPSTIEVTAELEKEVMTLDDEETFGNFYKSISPSALQDSALILTEDDLSQIQSNSPTSVNISQQQMT